ncbi:MAG: glycoside hydrolase family 3 C-terminal domain-containing protein [Firmicutes bacterium]|nr:glycoside hydrolase family 3 C-terminal domain-containing protein [Bacillota bacterium]
MKKVLDALKFVWKNNKLWLLVTVITMVIVFSATMVATQQPFIRNTLIIVLGDERETRSGNKAPHMRYTTAVSEFRQYEPVLAEIKTKEDSLAEGKRLNEKIVEEGVVLLKNELIGNKRALPLAKSAKVSVFGKNSANFITGGSGSSAGDAGGPTVLYDSLANAGFDVNPTLKGFYSSSNQSGTGRPKNPAIESSGLYGFATGETPQSKYTDSVIDSYGAYSDAAIVVFSRIGSEGNDMPRTMRTGAAEASSAVTGAGSPTDHYLQLDRNELALLRSVAGAKKDGEAVFKNIIVLINASTSMELGFLDEAQYNITGAFWVGMPGGAVNAIGKVISGEVNPSGRLVDTFARDFTQTPSYHNFGNNNVAGGNDYLNGAGVGWKKYFVEYEEGIYVGYRYFETRAYEEKENNDNPDWYDDNVVYPFGYGLSYDTDFAWEIAGTSVLRNGQAVSAADLAKDGLLADDKVEIKVKVTNNGNTPGKDVVQLYYSAPYYYEIEKSHVVLGDFAKTKTLAKGEDDEVTLTVSAFTMASYDYSNMGRVQGFKGYKLDEGTYDFFVGRNAHDAWAGADGFRDAASAKCNLSVQYDVKKVIEFKTDPATGKTIENRFSGGKYYEDVSGHIKQYLSRNDFEGTFPKAPTEEERIVSESFILSLEFFGINNNKKPYYAPPKVGNFDEGKPWESGDAVKTGVKNSAMLYDLIKVEGGVVSVDYEDPRWDAILDQITVREMKQLIGMGAFNTRQILSIGKPKTIDPDSPSGFVNFMGGRAVYDTATYASGCIIAATYNKELAYDFGVMIGIEGLIGDKKGDGRTYSGWYAPGANIHRSPFAGRNFEYYSEDGLLSGKIAANTVAGAKSKGVYAYIKHFAVNDQETNRDSYGLITWLSEQAMREIYLKPFEIAVKEGGAIAMMSSFNRIGTVWAGGSYPLLTEILREEWGFRGTVISDFNLLKHYPADQMIRAGGDLNLTQNDPPVGEMTATQAVAMRQATKNILYTVAQSNAMNGLGQGVKLSYAPPMWVILLIVANLVLLVGFAVWGFFDIRKKLKKQKAAAGDGNAPEAQAQENE